ncbi:YutD family protein [Candidatus Xianfuyuplasma coldseepsis]|uniref:YutD family protein n=1 Tax=Candidatus Xianfuyuplasma coldseepsis TaxID=2782163 RepID=A0A7L7KRT0_9MOLU|nr:YutD family protein [Xianfuyuplasma coldseepsis]QMS84906.1 YutD family protein [Xianfuyuplasma coldseepsis]
MIETDHGYFEIIKDYKEALEIKMFNDKYVPYLNRYKYIVGDYSADMLRLKGFTDKTVETIPDYLMESCTPNAPYFVLRRLNKKKPKN